MYISMLGKKRMAPWGPLENHEEMLSHRYILLHTISFHRGSHFRAFKSTFKEDLVGDLKGVTAYPLLSPPPSDQVM